MHKKVKYQSIQNSIVSTAIWRVLETSHSHDWTRSTHTKSAFDHARETQNHRKMTVHDDGPSVNERAQYGLGKQGFQETGVARKSAGKQACGCSFYSRDVRQQNVIMPRQTRHVDPMLA